MTQNPKAKYKILYFRPHQRAIIYYHKIIWESDKKKYLSTNLTTRKKNGYELCKYKDTPKIKKSSDTVYTKHTTIS